MAQINGLRTTTVCSPQDIDNQVKLAGLSMLALAMLASDPAWGAPPTCLTPAQIGATPLLDGWAIEGLITDYDQAGRTLTVNGMTFVLPTNAATLVDPQSDPLQTIGQLGRVNADGDLLVNTASPEIPKRIEFSCLVDPVNGLKRDPLSGGMVACFADSSGAHDPVTGAVRDIKGGTAIANGVYQETPAGSGCMAPTATDVEFLFGEHVSIGAFDYDPVSGEMSVNGQPFDLNQDPRLPVMPDDNIILGLSGLPITLGDLLNSNANYYKGTLVAVEGYYVPGQGTYAVLLETEAVPANPVVTNDTVGFERVEYRAGKRELRISGLVQAGTGRPAPTSVRLFLNAGVDVANGSKSCVGTDAGRSTTVLAVDGTFAFRLNNIAAPSTVCIESFDAGGDRGAGETIVTRLR